MVIAGLLVATALACAPQTPTSAAAATPPSPELPVSLDHIREALARPPGLRWTPPEVKPDFVVHVSERERFEKMMPPWDFRSGPVPPGGLYAWEQLQRSGVAMAQPLISVDLMAIAHEIGGAISAMRTAYATAAAREEVRRAIEAYCAAQPDRGAGIAICTTPR
jgi:hypothetical protein